MSLFSQDQLADLQTQVQSELERREWAEPGDSVMAEYICVLIGNGNSRDRVKAEMEDLVGNDFDAPFLDWLFERGDAIRSAAAAAVPPAEPEPTPAPAAAPAASEASGPSAGSRMFASAIEGTKRKADPPSEEPNKRRLPDGPLGAPTGPRAMQAPHIPSGPGGPRSLQERLAPRGSPMNAQRGGMNVRGMGRGPMGQQPFRPHGNMGQQQQQQQAFLPGQEEMMMQMMAMQANMMQMAAQMQQMQESTPQRPVRPPRTTPAKVPAGTKLGGHAVSPIQPRGGALGPIPDKPSSTALCKFGVGCSNARCTYSHPSPVADEKTGMVLSEEPCDAGKECKDAECVKSHVSPAAVLGETAGPSRVLCKFQHCTNPSCQYRHEDENGNFIPPPALGKAGAAAAGTPHKLRTVTSKASLSSEEGDVEVSVKPQVSQVSLDTALEDTKTERPCRYGERCTRADCKFSHPASRPTPRGSKPTRGGAPAFSKRAAPSSDAIVGGMGKSSKFSNTAPSNNGGLNPSATEFKPAGSAGAEPELEVTS